MRSERGGGATLPTGAVTFLLTDMEGSTSLLRRLEDRYAVVLQDVRRVIDRAVRAGNGHKVDAHGDEYLAVFARPADAIGAAVQMQRAMAAAPWPDGLEVRVRAGVHSGRPTLTDTGYVGLSVHTVARICSVAHGGQVLISSSTSAALSPAPDGVTWVSLGAHRLAGLPRDEELFQVQADGLATQFPPLRILR